MTTSPQTTSLSPRNTRPLSMRKRGQLIGALFLLALLSYGTGTLLVSTVTGTPGAASAAGEPLFAPGALLMLANSVIVAGIGVLFYPALRPHSQTAAHGYLLARVLEAALLAVGVVFLLLLVQPAADGGAQTQAAALADGAVAAGNYSYQAAMVFLALGSLFLCRVLFEARLVPRFLALWGFAGYLVFLAGAVLEILGYPLGVLLSIPGGLFEVFLGVWLLVKGLPNQASAPAARPAAAN